MTARLRVASVIRSCWDTYNRLHCIVPHAAETVRAILRCRTSELGGHMHRCDQCGGEVPVYNSCENRHCPTCQGSARRKWTDKRLLELLPVQYFHVVFTLPHNLNRLVDANRKVLFSEFFSVLGWVLQRFAHDPQWRLEGELGYIALLHTWNQLLQEHFHIHCLVPGGVWRQDTKQWIPCRRKWLFKKDSLADAFRNRFIKRLRSLRKRGKLTFAGCARTFANPAEWDALLAALEKQRWVVYPKVVPATPETALLYLARYTHKVAITDSRIKDISDGQVTFTWRDRKNGNAEEEKRIPVEEFTRRFLYHVLPRGFHKIRYGGWMSATKRKRSLCAIRKALGVDAPQPADEDKPLEQRIFEETGIDITLCPLCKKGHLIRTDKPAPYCDKPP